MTTETAEQREYTKEQEAEALAWVEKGTFCKLDLDVVLAMAKRTTEAERRVAELNAGLDAQVEDTKYLALKLKTAVTEHAIERDALKARVAELEAAHQGLADVLKEERRKAAPPPVIVTRELLEALLNFVQFEAERDRARLLTELREVLGRKP